MIDAASLLNRFDPKTGTIDGVEAIRRPLSALRGSFADTDAFEKILSKDDPVVYTVSTLTPGTGPGALHYGIGVLFPGMVGDEYYLTKGHFHSWREAAELYVGLRGTGRMLLENETTGESNVVEILPNSTVYVPGHTAHRTINVGSEPLVYFGIYPATAGHDYGEIAELNFRTVVYAKEGTPVAVSRSDYMRIRRSRTQE